MILSIKYSQERRSQLTPKRRFLAVAFLFATLQTIGCVGATDDQPGGKVPGQASNELRLVKAEYPIPGEDGSVICAQYEYDGEDGLTYTISEQYDEGFAKLRSVFAADAALERVANERGLSVIDTCDDARKFTKIWNEYTESAPSLARKPEAGGTRPPRELSTDLIEKVKDSSTFSGKAVIVRMFAGGTGYCSGFFIDGSRVVTAAHCLPSSGNKKITIESFAGCVYPFGTTDCLTAPIGNNAWGQKHSGFTGGDATAHDIAIFELDGVVSSPMNSSSNWLRVATSDPWQGQSVWLDAWGANVFGGSGGGTQRLSNQDIEIDWAGAHHFYFTIVAGEGRSCHGDSGGPTIATGVASEDIAIGDVSNSDKMGTNACGSEGQRDRHVVLSDNTDFLVDWAGPCSTFTGFSSDFTYMRCW